MKGDFARVTFEPTRHYSRVLQQQGRVLLEADWNEQAAIHLDLLRTLAVDLVGPCWAAGDGFSINPAGASRLGDWKLSPGHFYVDGILCVNESECSLAAQAYKPVPEFMDDRLGKCILWLDVWERHLSSIEAPSSLDAALNGVDTASRAQVVWQVRALTEADIRGLEEDLKQALRARRDDRNTGTADLDPVFDKWRDSGDWKPDEACEALRPVLGARERYACPRLAASLERPGPDADPCVIPADARYRGCENQLYRVEIHDGGPAVEGRATFKWSRENGSVVFAIEAISEASEDGSVTITLASLGRDARLGLSVGDWVELVHDELTLSQRVPRLHQVTAIDTHEHKVTLSIEGDPMDLPDPPSSGHALMRRWDQRDDAGVHGVPLKEGEWLPLEDGVHIYFERGGLYASGDYWLIPARVADNGMLDWPQDATGDGPARKKPMGLHHYAVLGVVGDDGFKQCFCRFQPLCSRERRTRPAPVRTRRTRRSAASGGGATPTP